MKISFPKRYYTTKHTVEHADIGSIISVLKHHLSLIFVKVDHSVWELSWAQGTSITYDTGAVN